MGKSLGFWRKNLRKSWNNDRSQGFHLSMGGGEKDQMHRRQGVPSSGAILTFYVTIGGTDLYVALFGSSDQWPTVLLTFWLFNFRTNIPKCPCPSFASKEDASLNLTDHRLLYFSLLFFSLLFSSEFQELRTQLTLWTWFWPLFCGNFLTWTVKVYLRSSQKKIYII